MSDQDGAQGTNDQSQGDAAPELTQEEITNAAAKDLPWVKKMAAELNELREQQAKAKQAEEQARKEAAIKEAEAKGQYEEALKLREAEIADLKSTHEKQLLERDLTTELAKAGFANEMFLKGAVSGYDPENGPIADYVKSLAEDESNKAFLTTARNPIPAPGTTPVSGGNGSLTVAQIEELQKPLDQGGTLENRARAREYLKNYYEKHGNRPEGLKSKG